MHSEHILKENLSKEFLSFLHINSEDALKRYLQIKQVLLVQFHQPEIDFIRQEIGRCYVTASCHGMITLTNLLLERYCKLILIYKSTGFKSIQDLKNLEDEFKPANKKYSKMSLGETLEECLNENIINKSTYDFFLEVKNRFRDGFGHADTSKILKGQLGRFTLGKFNDLSISEVKKLTIQNIPPLHGIAVQQFATENGWGYFISVENLIRTTIKDYINDHFEVDIEMTTPIS